LESDYLRIRSEELMNKQFKLLKEMCETKLTDKQMQIFENNRDTMGRTALAKEMGISKLQLNHVMNGMAIKRKMSGKKLDVSK
jgi:predicted DNA binding protein